MVIIVHCWAPAMCPVLPESVANKRENVRCGFCPSEAHVLIIQNPKSLESIIKFLKHFDSRSSLFFNFRSVDGWTSSVSSILSQSKRCMWLLSSKAVRFTSLGGLLTSPLVALLFSFLTLKMTHQIH